MFFQMMKMIYLQLPSPDEGLLLFMAVYKWFGIHLHFFSFIPNILFLGFGLACLSATYNASIHPLLLMVLNLTSICPYLAWETGIVSLLVWQNVQLVVLHWTYICQSFIEELQVSALLCWLSLVVLGEGEARKVCWSWPIFVWAML